MFDVKVKLRRDRQTLISKAVGASNDTHIFHEFRNQRKDLPLIRLDITIPLYRLNNYRTSTAQIKCIRDQGHQKDFFSGGEENDPPQRAQHDILSRMAKEGTGSIAKIWDELETNRQREPLVITADGVTVNGNRRLAAMRELYAQDPGTFSSFSHVNCAVLPEDASNKEIREIEVRLQMRPETRLPYDWINEALAVDDMIKNGDPVEYIADLMNKRRGAIQQMAQALNEARLYLQEWLKRPDEFQLVEDHGQFFNDMAKALHGIEGDALEARRRIGWGIASNSEKFDSRIYDYNFSFRDKANEVIKELSNRCSIDLGHPPHDDDDEDIDISLEDDNDGTGSLVAFIRAFDDTNQRDAITEALVDICHTVREQSRQGEIGQRALQDVQKAHAKLMSVDISKADIATHDAIGQQLSEIEKQVTDLQDTLKKYGTDHSSGD